MTASGHALLIVLVVTAGLAGFVGSRFLVQAPPTEAPRPAPPGEIRAAATPAATARPTPVPTAAPPVAAIAPPPARPELPRFDVVRVGARGVAVMAGRAGAGAEVLLLEDGREIGRARADARGDWVILPAEPLRPGTRQFSLLSRLGGAETAGADRVVVAVPEPEPPRHEAEAASRAEPAHQEAAATPPRRAEAALPAQPLVLLLPAAQAAPRVLQGPAPQQGLGLGQVDYDEAGAIRFAGTAAPGAVVRLYVDDRHTGDAQADGQGRWTLAPGDVVAIGRHRLRVDQIAAAGAVSARIEVPFQRDRLPEEAFAGGRVIVQPGNNLWRLARAAYGRGVQYSVIYEANREQIRSPSRIFPGQVFTMPGLSADGSLATPADSSRSR